MNDELNHEDDGDDRAIGWEAIDAALDALYGGVDPMHWGTVLPYGLGGEDPLHGVSVYENRQSPEHLHYITYGFSDLYEKENDDPEWSGFGFELTFRLAARLGDEPPVWVVNLMQNLARYVFHTGNSFGPGHTLPLNSPICLEMDTLIRTITFVDDPVLGTIETPHGKVRFLQVVGLTDDELDATQCWNAQRFTELIRDINPLLVTDVQRTSYLDQPELFRQVKELTALEGASAGIMCSNEFRILQDSESSQVTLVLGAIVAASLGRRLRGRLPFDRDFRLTGETCEIHFSPADKFEVKIFRDHADVRLTDQQVQVVTEKMLPQAGTWTFEDLPGLTLVIEPTEIKDNDGNVTDIVG